MNIHCGNKTGKASHSHSLSLLPYTQKSEISGIFYIF